MSRLSAHMPKSRESRILLAALALGFLYRALFIYRGISWLTDFWFFEDWGYAMNIAKHIAAGAGETVDGVVKTNGYQPLYVWLLIPVFWIWRVDPVPPAYVAITLSAVMNLLTGLCLYRTLRRLAMPEFWCCFGLLFWMLNLNMARTGTNGLDSGLSTLLGAMIIYVVYSADLLAQSQRRHLSLGVLFGLAFLARIDNTALLLAFAVYLVSAGIRITGESGSAVVSFQHRSLLRPLGPVAVGVLMVVTPYLTYNQLVHGAPLPTSVTAVTSGALRGTPWSLLPKGAAQTVSDCRQAVYCMAEMLRGGMTANGYRWYDAKIGEPLFVAVIVLLGLALFRFVFLRRWQTVDKRHLFPLATLGGFLYAYVIYGPFIPFERYFYTPVYVLILFFIMLLARIDAISPRRILFRLFIGALLAVSFVDGAWPHFRNRVPYKAGWYSGITAVNRLVKPNTTAAALQSGNLGYLYAGGRVINLDGVVNFEAFQERQRHNLCGYLKKEGVRLVADEGEWVYFIGDSCADGRERDAYVASLRLLHASTTYAFNAYEIVPVRYSRIRNADASEGRFVGDWKRVNDGRMINRDVMMTAVRGGKFSFESDRSFDLRLVKHDWSGIVNINVGGHRVDRLDLYSEAQNPSFMYHYENRSGQKRSIEVEVSGERNAKSRSTELFLDAVLEY